MTASRKRKGSPLPVCLLKKNATFPRNSQQTSCDQNWSHMSNSKSFTRMGSAWLAKTSHFLIESCEGDNIWTNPGYLVGNQECLPVPLCSILIMPILCNSFWDLSATGSLPWFFFSEFLLHFLFSSHLIAGLSALLFYALGVSVCTCLFNSTHFFSKGKACCHTLCVWSLVTGTTFLKWNLREVLRYSVISYF